MGVIDAGVVVGLLTNTVDAAVIDGVELSAPHLIDSEVIHALRRMTTSGRISPAASDTAFAGFRLLAIRRRSASPLLDRMWELRHNLSGYDATYVALAEAIDEPLLTTDRRLAAAPGIRCQVRVV
ncbi:MAG: type II toxin-antitoxin system VapC family toxin [Microlunatus sp.]